MSEQPAVERFTRDDLDRMVREADRCRDAVIRLSPLDDVCTHVKALAAEVEQWQKDYLACEQERSHLANVVVPALRREVAELRAEIIKENPMMAAVYHATDRLRNTV